MINVGLIGAGRWGKNYLKGTNDIINITMVSTFQSRSVQNEPFEHTTNYMDILHNKSIDAVIIATPIKTHYMIVKAALNLGKHVLVEKPFTDNSENAKELTNLANKKNLVLMIGHIFLYHPAIIKIKEILKNKEIGTIKSIMSKRLSLSFFNNALWELGPHDLYIITYLLEEYPLDISTTKLNNTIDYLMIKMKFSSFEANIELSTSYPDKIRQLRIQGSKGILFFDDMNNDKLVFINNYNEESLIKINNNSPLIEQVKHFVDCIQNDKIPNSNGLSGYNNITLLENIDKL